jgi:hypothetical protein
MRSISFYSRCWLVARSSSGRNPVSRESPPNGRNRVSDVVKILAGYHQFDAVRKAVDRTLSATAQGGDRKAGVIWPVPMLMMVMPR